MTEERRPTEEDGRIALRDHVVEKAAVARAKYGGHVGHAEILAMLEDREVVRFPTTISFDERPLQPGEFAYAAMVGEHPSQGFRIYVHPAFMNRPDLLPLLIAYHLVRVNYGEIASHVEAELFGATLLGLDVDDYYETLCAAADSLAAPTPRG